jgi:peptidoglycan/LPS O-acetylase OafA/YrhL
MAESSTSKRYHLPFLDMLRAVAAFLVLLGHSRNWIFQSIDTVDHPGILLKLFWLVTVLHHEAVVLFFALSGFLVGGSVLRSTKRGTFSFVNYFIARFSRIFIVYFPALALTGLIFWAGHYSLQDYGEGTIRPLFSEFAPTFSDYRQAVCHIAGVQGFGCTSWTENPALWSLGYEWAIYVIAPIAFAFLLRSTPLAVRVVGLILLALSVVSLSNNAQESAFWISAWFLGAAASRVHDNYRLPILVGISGLLLMLLGMAASRLQIVDILITDTVICIGTIIAISCRSLVAVSIFPRFFNWAASWSFSLYAVHLPIIFFVLAAYQNLGLPTRKVVTGPLAFMEFSGCLVVALTSAYSFSLFTERNTDLLRQWLLRQKSEAVRTEPLATSAPVTPTSR